MYYLCPFQRYPIKINWTQSFPCHPYLFHKQNSGDSNVTGICIQNKTSFLVQQGQQRLLLIPAEVWSASDFQSNGISPSESQSRDLHWNPAARLVFKRSSMVGVTLIMSLNKQMTLLIVLGSMHPGFVHPS